MELDIRIVQYQAGKYHRSDENHPSIGQDAKKVFYKPSCTTVPKIIKLIVKAILVTSNMRDQKIGALVLCLTLVLRSTYVY